MDEREKLELTELKRRQALLSLQLQALGNEISELERRWKHSEVQAAIPLSPTPALDSAIPKPAAGTTQVQPAVVPPTPPIPAKLGETPPVHRVFAPPPLPVIPEMESRHLPQPESVEIPIRPAVDKQGSSLEMKLGTYWLVRIGIVMLLTGLVFFGAYAYQNFSGLIGPGGKLAILYAVSGVLLGAGFWLQRNQEKMRNYGEVLVAGGLAGIYFTTYAAHHVARLMVIKSGLVDGGLLLVWAGSVIWLADRRKSEVLALSAVLLAYYTSVMTHVGQFTLYSNLVLTGAAVFFLVKNRWAALSFVSLVATYLSYIFWRFYQDGQWRWTTPNEGLWTGICFLAAYWVAFTVAVFLSRHKELGGKRRAAFLSLNNGAFFCAYVMTMLQVHHGGFWKFALTYGAVLIALAFLGRRYLGEDLLFGNTYLTQGILLVTLGFITYYEGLRLSLILAAESIVLVTLGKQMKSRVLDLASVLAAGLATIWCGDNLQSGNRDGEAIGLIVGVANLFNCWWLLERGEDRNRFDLIRRVFYALLSLGLFYVVTHLYAERRFLAPLLALEAVVFAISIYLLGLKEYCLLGQLFLPLAQAVWLSDALTSVHQPWWNPVALIAITLGMAAWWQRQKTIQIERQILQGLLGIYAFAVVALTYYWLEPDFPGASRLAMLSGLAIVTTLYAAVNRYWLLAATGQIFIFVAVVEYGRQLWEGKLDWYFPLAPIGAPLALSLGAIAWLKRRPEGSPQVREQVLQIGLIYRVVSVLMSLWWINQFIPGEAQCWFYGLAGILLFALAGRRKNREILIFSAVFSVAALAKFVEPFDDESVTLPNLLVLLALLVQQRVARNLPARFAMPKEAHAVVIAVGGLALWLYLSRWILQQASGFYLTAGWSALALVFFIIGMALRERIYRWLGLLILACSLGRVVFFDIWKLETIYRVLSLTALGIVLLVLGFIYNKYQEKIKEWL